MSLLRGGGPRTRALRAALRRRERAGAPARTRLDERVLARLARPRAVVFTDTDDFTRRVARDGIVHFLMAFDRAVRRLVPGLARLGGRLVKVEADSLLLVFPDALAACRGVALLESRLARANRDRPPDERLAFSYGVGYGPVLELEEDVFGLEVNLASKLGEDRARPGDVLLTPSAAAALPPAWRARAARCGTVGFCGQPMAVYRLRAPRKRPRA
jgi:class 3 adenylate cyclase